MGDIRTSANASFRDFATAGVPASGDHEPVKSEVRASFGVVEDAVTAASADIAAAVLSGGNVYADTTAGLAAVAEGEYFFVPVAAGLELFRDVSAVAVSQGVVPSTATLDSALDRLPGVFRSTVTDPLLTDTIIEAHVIGAWAHEDFYVNVRFLDYGDPYYKWPAFKLHDADGDVVAQWSKNPVNPDTESDWIFLTNVVNGSLQAPYQGIVAALRIDWAAVTALGWNDALTTHTTTAAAGLRREVNRPPEALLDFLGDMEPAETLVAGTGEAYATVNAAVEALWIDDGTTVSRSTMPNSDRASPARLVQIRAVDATIDEAITARTILTIETGLVLPAWGELYMPKGSRLKMLAGGDAPVLEMNMPGRLRGGGTAENFGDGYAMHMDNSLPRRAANGPAILRYYNVHLIEDWTFIAHGTGSTAIPVGASVSNGMKVLFRRCEFRRGAGTAPLVAFHTTPDTTDAGEVGFEGCYFDPAYVAAQFLKKHTTPTGLRHKIWFRDCEGGAVQYGDPDVIGGTVPFVRAGTINGFTSISSELDPS